MLLSVLFAECNNVICNALYNTKLTCLLDRTNNKRIVDACIRGHVDADWFSLSSKRCHRVLATTQGMADS